MEQVREKPKNKKKKREKPPNTEGESSLLQHHLNVTEKEVDSCEESLETTLKDNEKEITPEIAQEATIIDTPKIEEANAPPEIQETNKFEDLLTKNKSLVSEIKNQEKLKEMVACRKEPIKTQIRPYSEAQLAALYTNTELEMLEQFSSQYVEAELKGLAVKQHTLYELLSHYLQIRTEITGNSLELDQFRKEYSDLQGTLWTTDTAVVTGRNVCQDGTYVSTTHSYQKATFHRSVFQSLIRVLGQIRKLTYENHILCTYKAEDLRLQIELYIQTAILNCTNVSQLDRNSPVILSLQSEPPHLQPYFQEIRLCISVMFAFQRKLVRDSQFIKETRSWLSRLISVLLRVATYQDHLFILSHILRCPPGVGSWASAFLQIPIEDNFIETPFSSYQINHLLTVLLALLSPIKERDRFLEDLSQMGDTPGDSHWIVVDSDGEEDDESGTSLRENDLVALLSQLPFEALFRATLLIQKKDFQNCYDSNFIDEQHILRFLAFSTVFLKIINKGLQTYSQLKYNQFSKRLSRLIRHLVQYASDQWESFKDRETNDPAMLLRLQVEYDAFFIRAIHYLYTSQKLGGWQFLAVVPYNLITIETVWKIFHFLHDSDATAQEILNPDKENDFSKIWNSAFRVQFEEKMSTLADDELYYLLNTFANMALARDSQDMQFIEIATRDLLEMGFVSKATQEICSKSARTLLTHITSKHPHLLANIIKTVQKHLEEIGALALYLYAELPLTIWVITDEDLAIIATLLNHSVTSNESKLARMILSRLNWDIIPYPMHCDVALLVVKTTEQEPGCLQWGWQTILRLKLHLNDKGVSNFQQVLHPENYDSIMKGIKQQQLLPSFVSILLTSWGHLIPEICSNGFTQLILLQTNQKHEAVLFALYLIVPLFVSSQEYITNNEKFQEIVVNLINADRGYISMAKSLIVVQNTVLQQFGNMIETQIVNFASYGLESPRLLVRLWINTLVCIPAWNKDTSVLYLLDVIVRAAFFYKEALEVVNSVFRDLLKSSAAQEQSGAISSLFKWVSNNSNNGALIAGSLSNTTWLAYVVIELEHEVREMKTGLWRELLIQLHKQTGKISVDAGIKKAASVLKLPSFSSSNLCVYRWAQQAMDSPIEHPLVPLLWQKFFSLYLARLPPNTDTDKACIGEKFFSGVINFAFLKRIKRKLQDTFEYYQLKSTQTEDESDERKLFITNGLKLFQAFNAWLEEPRLQKNNLLLPALPPIYQPNLLAFIIQGSNTPWYEYVDYDSIKSNQLQCVLSWKVANFRQRNNINRPLLNPGKSIESSDPTERILRRLSVYEVPKPPPELTNSAPVIPVFDFTDKQTLFSTLEQCFKTLKQFAHNQTMKVSEHKALDCSYQELIPQLYRSVLLKVTKKIPCKGPNDTVNCSGAAIILLEMQEARINDRIDHEINTNRAAYESLLSKSLQIPGNNLWTASISIQQAIRILQMQRGCNPTSAELGVELFYYILKCINEETTNYLPTKTLFASCLDKLGASHICGVEFEMSRLLETILKEPSLGCFLAPHFSPINIGTANLLFMYSIICRDIGTNYEVAFALLSKFEIEVWLKNKQPKLSQRTEFIQCVIKSLSMLGFDPPLEAEILHALYRRHLLAIFEFQFPEHYGEILVCLLKASNGNTESSLLARSVWMDILGFLSNPVIINPNLGLREPLRLYAQQQRLLQHQELLESAELFANHFTKERLQYGLYGLYPKSRNYIDVYVVLLGMTGHGLIISMLNAHQGLLGDKLSQKIWPYLTNIFAPWIVPYSMQNLKENMASWIQQLADDRSILLPWIPSDGSLAQKIISVFCECIQFLIHTLPACSNILSFIWQWYVACFAHPSVKDHILGPIHHAFLAFQWEKFWPSVADLECMLRVIEQYLPDSHAFLGHIFMSVSWSAWLSNFKNSPPPIKSRVYHGFLTLIVKLSNEPKVRHLHSTRARALLMEAENYDWTFMEAVHFQQVMDWYVLSCDPGVIFKTDSQDIDFRVLYFLMVVSGYNKAIVERGSTDLFKTQLIFVRSFVKLMSVYVNRHKSLLASKDGEINTVISKQLAHLESVVGTDGEEFNGILRELLGLVNIAAISHFAVKRFTLWITNKEGIVIKGLMGVMGTTIMDNEALATLCEATIAAYFQNNVAEIPSWGEITDTLKIPPNKHLQLEQILINNGHILTLNALYLQKIKKCTDPESVINLGIDWVATIKPNENNESKIPVLWFGILRLSQNYCEENEVVVGALLYKFAKILLQLSEERSGSGWGRGLLNVIGINKQDTVSINFRFLGRALGGYILAQLPEMKGEPQVVRHAPNASSRVGQTGGNIECSKVLMSLDFGASQGKLKECEQLVLNQIQNAENSLHNASKFLELLVRQFYIKAYLKDVWC